MRLLLLTLALFGSALFVACGSDDEGNGGNDAAPATAGRPQTTTAGTTVAQPTAGTQLAADSDGNAPGIPPLTGQIQTTASGLKYIDQTVGTGASPQTGQQVTVHYTGWLTDGTKFDSSVDRGQPFVFAIGQRRVIAGWDEGVATMKIGGKRRLIIPAALAYGPQARGSIPANSTLIFDVELISIQ